MEMSPHARGGSLEPGTPVEVRNGLSMGWAGGFEVAAVEHDGYRLRRLSDGSVLPAVFEPEFLRPRAGLGRRRA